MDASLGLAIGISRLGTFAWSLSPDVFRLGLSAWHLSLDKFYLAYLRLGSLAWEPRGIFVEWLLRIFRLEIALETTAWDLWLSLA